MVPVTSRASKRSRASDVARVSTVSSAACMSAREDLAALAAPLGDRPSSYAEVLGEGGDAHPQRLAQRGRLPAGPGRYRSHRMSSPIGAARLPADGSSTEGDNRCTASAPAGHSARSSPKPVWMCRHVAPPDRAGGFSGSLAQGASDGCADQRRAGTRPDAPADGVVGHYSVDCGVDSPSAYRREGCVGGWAAVCSQPSSRCGGPASWDAGPPSRGTRHSGGPDVTVYMSRFVATSRAVQRPGAQPSAPVAAVADPPLLTHVWRRFFEQRSRPGFRR